jgi:ATP-dependent RNA helicase DeaD
MGYTVPTPIQELAIPALLAGRDVVGKAQTGTGKTAAFGIPMVERLDPAARYTQAIVLEPTRELAVQVAEELRRLSRFRGLRVATIYGGQPIDRQFTALQAGAHIVVGTPGRILDHIGRGTLHLDRVRIAILDEADEMLDIGFADDMVRILGLTPRDRQTALFSATIPPFIRRLVHRFLKEPQWVHLGEESEPPDTIRQVYYEVTEDAKLNGLLELLRTKLRGEKALVFRRTQWGVDKLVDMLQRRGVMVEGIHGGLRQNQRDAVMRTFRAGTLRILAATNVAARGLDIPAVSHVVNYDMPASLDEYVHRIGRTGRIGRDGTAITFVGEGDFPMLDTLQARMGAGLQRETFSFYA